MADDAHWDPDKRRALRQEMRDALSDTYKKADETSIPEELLRRLQYVNGLQRQIVAPREAAIDSEHLRILSSIARERAQSSRGELVVFEAPVYCEKLITYMNGEREDDGSCSNLDWHKLGVRAIRAFKVAPTVNFIHGSLEATPLKVRTKRAMKPRTSLTIATEKPKELDGFEEEEEATTRGVQHVFRCLKKACTSNKEIHYFKFLVDPSSFAHTVENVFHFSFLIKEGKAGMKLGSDDQPYIYLPASGGVVSSDNRKQCIVSLDKKDWEQAIKKYNITEAIIPHKN